MNSLIPMEYKNQRIMTTKILAEQFGTEEKNIQMNFLNNQSRFKEGKHFIKLEGQALKDFKNSLPNDIGLPLKFASVLTLWTDRGAARHAKILDTDEAWEVYEQLEENYFNPKKQNITVPQIDSKFLFQIATQLEEKEKQIALMQPKADYFDNLVDRNLLTNFRDTAKELKVKETIFINWLLKKYIYRDSKGKLKPYSDHVPELFEVKEFAKGNYKNTQTLITPRGRETFRLLLIQDGLIEEAKSLI